jgi:hypothetical protein
MNSIVYLKIKVSKNLENNWIQKKGIVWCNTTKKKRERDSKQIILQNLHVRKWKKKKFR